MYKQGMNLAKGIGIGMIAGAAVTVVGSSLVRNNKKTIKKTAGKAAHAMGDLLGNVETMLFRG